MTTMIVMVIGQIFNNRERQVNLYSNDVEVDYRGTDVSVESFLRLLTGIHADWISVPCHDYFYDMI